MRIIEELKKLIESYKISLYYDKITIPFSDITKPYIFLALQCQPEKSTSPLAGLFVDEYLAADLICSAMPENWLLVIKEHPAQFEYFKSVVKSKSSNYYNRFLNNVRVVFIPNNLPEEQIISNSECVAVMSGSVGYKSALLGKKVMLFGADWYSGIPGINKVSTTNDIRAALDSKILPSMHTVLDYLESYQKNIILGYTHVSYERKSLLSRKLVNYYLHKLFIRITADIEYGNA